MIPADNTIHYIFDDASGQTERVEVCHVRDGVVTLSYLDRPVAAESLRKMSLTEFLGLLIDSESWENVDYEL